MNITTATAVTVRDPWSLVPSLGNLDAYISAVNRLPLLSLDEEQDAARRLREAEGLMQLCERYGTQLIINDDAELAARLGVGLHLGQGDGSLAAARTLLGLDDLLARFGQDVDLGGLGGNIAAKGDKFAPHGKVIDHLGIVAGGVGRDRGAGEADEIGGAAEFLEALVILEEGFHRDGACQGVFLDAGGGAFEDALVDRVVEMFCLHEAGDAVIDIVIGQDRAQKLLLGLDIMRQDLGFGGRGGGQHRAQQGEVLFDGQDVGHMDAAQLYAARRRMGMLFQFGALFTDMSVFENVAFPLREHTDLSEALIRDVVLMKLHAVGLRGARDLAPSQISGGMARRVALARAIVLDPELVMYDEPFAGLDPISLGTAAQLIRQLNDAMGLTSIIVSHDLEETFRLADHVIILGEGVVAAQGTPDEVRASRDPLVHQFVNALPAGPVPFHYPSPDPAQDFGPEGGRGS